MKGLGIKAGMEDEMAKILILGEHPNAREFLVEELAGEGHLVVAIGRPSLIGELLTALEPDLVLLDFLRGKVDLWGALGEIKRRDPHLPVFTFTSYGLYKEEIRFEVKNEFGIETFSLEILNQKVVDLLKRKPTQEFRRVRGDLFLPRTQFPFSRAKDQPAAIDLAGRMSSLGPNRLQKLEKFNPEGNWP